jgi:hypothetical protein
MKVVDLPLSLFGLVRDYICLCNNYTTPNYVVDWIRFCNSCKSSTMKDIKKKFIVYHLNSIHSVAYLRYFTEDSQSTNGISVISIINNVSDPRKQITLDFIYSDFVFTDDFFASHASFFRSINGLVLPLALNISDKALEALMDLDFLSLACCNTISDLSFLKTVKVLSLDSCPSLQNHNSLGNCEDIYVTHCTISDISNLTHVKWLNLQGGNYLSNDIPLMQNHFLSFCNCNITLSNPSNLGNVYELDLQNCVNIQDFSGFHSVVKLNILGINQVLKGLPVNNKLKRLSIQGKVFQDLGIQNFPESQKRVLKLYLRADMPVISLLQQFQYLIFSETEGEDKEVVVAGLSCLKSLSVFNCRRIMNVKQLPSLRMLTMRGSDVLIDFLTLPQLTEISAEECYHSGRFPVEIKSTSLRQLRLVNCPLKELHLYCDSLQSLYICNKNIRDVNRSFPIHLHGTEIEGLFLSLPHPIIQYSCEKTFSFRLNDKSRFQCDAVGGRYAL